MAKVRQLEQLYPQIGAEESIADATATIQTPVEHLDLATVIKVSEAVSGEIVLEKLIDTLMRTAIEHAGAERGLLILPRGDDYRIEAEATTSSDQRERRLRQASVTAADLPSRCFSYVLRTKESVLLHDASGQNPFAADEYIRGHHARSVLCLPLLKQTRLVGVLYLENSLTPARVHSRPNGRPQVAGLGGGDVIGEHASVWRPPRARGAGETIGGFQHRRGPHLGISTDRFVEANDAFLNMLQYGREDLVSGGVRWTDLTPAEWREARRTRDGGSQVDGDGSALREGVLPEGWQSRPRADWRCAV